MSIVKMLIEGLTEKDWSKIQSAVNALTGTVTESAPPKKKGRPKKSEPVQVAKRPNLFESMSIKEERPKGYDQIRDDVAPTERKRQPYSPKEVVCVGCRKTFEVHPQFVRDSFRCDSCVKGR
jgi:hypothetical protein